VVSFFNGLIVLYLWQFAQIFGDYKMPAVSKRGIDDGALPSRLKRARNILSQRTNVVTHLFDRNPDFEFQLQSMGRDF
jgi:hypothetical protein